jgi:hypothetical protein
MPLKYPLRERFQPPATLFRSTDRAPTPTRRRTLCDNINRILANREGTVGGALILPGVKGIKIDSPED